MLRPTCSIGSKERNTEFFINTGWHTKCHTIDCAHNTFLLLQKHLTSGTELIPIGCKIVPNEEHVQCDHSFVTTFRHKSSESARHNFTMWALSCATFSGLFCPPKEARKGVFVFVCRFNRTLYKDVHGHKILLHVITIPNMLISVTELLNLINFTKNL